MVSAGGGRACVLQPRVCRRGRDSRERLPRCPRLRGTLTRKPCACGDVVCSRIVGCRGLQSRFTVTRLNRVGTIVSRLQQRTGWSGTFVEAGGGYIGRDVNSEGFCDVSIDALTCAFRLLYPSRPCFGYLLVRDRTSSSPNFVGTIALWLARASQTLVASRKKDLTILIA